jgi:hypothetical protein
LITTCYKNQNADIFSQHDSEKAIYLEYDGNKKGETVPNPNDIGIKPLKEDGDFRSKECIELLKEADIVVTNPPFSLFREYVAQLIEYDKKFLIIGNQNAITYKEIFKLIKENKLWLGVSMNGSNRWMGVPEHYEFNPKAKHKIDENGRRYIFVNSVVWFTNLEHSKRNEEIILYKKYNPEEYPKYDNYDAINLDKVSEIPVDYDGVFGVPISFMHKYNPEQFEILGIDRYIENNPNFGKRFTINGKETYARILIKRKQ